MWFGCLWINVLFVPNYSWELFICRHLKCWAHSPTSSLPQFSPLLLSSCFWSMRHINHFLECSHSQGRSELLWSEWVLTHFLCLAKCKVDESRVTAPEKQWERQRCRENIYLQDSLYVCNPVSNSLLFKQQYLPSGVDFQGDCFMFSMAYVI